MPMNIHYIKPDWPVPASIQAFTTVRRVWGGQRLSEGNECQEQENAALQSLLNLPGEPVWLKQVHGKEVIEARAANRYQMADASYSRVPHQVCVVMTADCLPILICDQHASCVAAIHAGWRGLAQGIIGATLQCLNIPSNDVRVWLGPAIGQQKFEVGEDVYTQFTAQDAQTSRAFTPLNKDKWLANLYELARMQLHQRGVHHIYGGQYCTYTQEDLFYSYRRDKGKTGRMASLIWMDKE